MTITDKKDKGSILLRINGESMYLALGNKEEAGYLKFVRHLLVKLDGIDDDVPDFSSGETVRIVYKLSAGQWQYVFISKRGDDITVTPMSFESERDAARYKNDFFEAGASWGYEEDDVPEIKSDLFRDRRVILALVLVFVMIFGYVIVQITKPRHIAVTSVQTIEPPAALSDIEKNRLKVIGSRMLAKRASAIISGICVRKDIGIPSISAQKSEAPRVVSYSVNIREDYPYPEVGTTATAEGIWGKGLSDGISVERKDIRPISSDAYEMCAARMMNGGFFVKARRESCADFTYEGSGVKTIDAFNSIMGCYVWLNSLNIAEGRGKLDVTLCRP